MDKEVLEVVLKNSQRESSIKRIIDLKWESALPKGENFTSSILRLTLKVVLGNGRVGRKSYIMKKETVGEATNQLNKDYDVFKKEAAVYIDIFREMDFLMEEFGDTEGPLWCELIYFNQADGIIVLEDLKATGFRTVKRTEAQNLEHARLALRGLGRYHAMAKVLEERGLVSKDDYKPYLLLYSETYVRNFIYGGLLALVKGMRATWGDEWAEAANKLSQMSFKDLLRRIQNCGKFDENTFQCLNHGDFWNNNMMFKYNWEEKPIQIRFVDFQFPHYNSPCTDVIFFMYSTIHPNLRRQNYQSLIKLYHESLTRSLELFEYKGSKPSIEDINNTMEQLTFYGLCFYLGFFPVTNSELDNGLDFDKLLRTNGEEGYNMSIFQEEGLIEKIGEDIKTLVTLL